MIISLAKVSVVLPCLAVLCALLIAGIAVMAVLIKKTARKNSDLSEKDVYIRINDSLNADNVLDVVDTEKAEEEVITEQTDREEVAENENRG